MARRKKVAPQAARPSLDEIRAKPGKYLIATYRGYESGGILISPPDAYEMGLPQGYVPKDLMIEPWQWTPIPMFWLDDGRFAQLYQSTPGLIIDKVDRVPDRQDLLALPPDLARRDKLTRERVQKAYWIATQPYVPKANMGDPKEAYKKATYDLIHMNSMETTLDSPEQVSFLQEELAPILEAALVFEERLGNRPEVINDIDKRLREIGDKRAYKRQPRTRTIYS